MIRTWFRGLGWKATGRFVGRDWCVHLRENAEGAAFPERCVEMEIVKIRGGSFALSAGSGISIWEFRVGAFGYALVDGVHGELETIRRSELVEDAEKIISDSVLAEMKLASDVAIGAAFRNETDNAHVTLGEQTGSLGIGDGGFF
jgi:hypothetical protein